MDQSELTPNPIIFFASFLIFLSYIYNKLLEPRYRSAEKEHYHEQYALQDHYFSNGPQVYTTHAQERPPFFFEEAYNHNVPRPHFPHPLAAPKDFGNNYIQYKPLQHSQKTMNESISYDEGWPSRDPDIHFPDISAIHGSTRVRGGALSPNNDSFDYNLIDQRNGIREECYYVESRNSLSLEIPAKNLKNLEKTEKSPVRAPNPRRGPVYVESSDTDTEHKPKSKKGNGQNLNEDAMEIIEEKTLPSDKRRYEDLRKKEGSMDKSDKLNETDYEPGVKKKLQEHAVGANIPNGKTVEVQNVGIRVKEVTDYYPSSAKKSKKNVEQQTKNKNSKMSDSKNKGQKMEEEHRFSKKDYLNKSISLDGSYSNGYSNQSLKKYIAKKTVQEQAFRGKETISSGDLKTVIGQKKSVVPVVSTAASTASGSLFGNSDTGSTQKSTGGLFSNTNTTTPAKSGGDSDFMLKVISEKNQSTAANTTASASDTEKKPTSSLFSNNSLSSQEPKKTEENKAQGSTAAKSLFGDASATTSSLFGSSSGENKPAVSNNTSTPNQTSSSGSGLFRNDSTVQPSTQTENKGIPRVSASSDLTQNAQSAQNTQDTQQNVAKSLFGNLTSTITNSTGTTQPTENAQEKKDEQSQAPKSGGLFAQILNSGSDNKPTASNPSEEKKSSGLFGGLTSNQTSAPTSNETKTSATSSLFMPSSGISQAPAQTDQKKEEPKSSLFGGNESVTSSLFGNNSSPQKSAAPIGTVTSSLFGNISTPQKNPAPTENTSINISPAATSLFGNAPKQNETAPALSGLLGNTPKPNEPAAPQNTITTPNAICGANSGGLFGNLTPPENKPAPPASGIFANFKSSQGDQSTGTGNASAIDRNTAGSSGLFGNMQQAPSQQGGAASSLFGSKPTTDNAPKSGGLFGNLGNTGGSSTGSGGLFSNLQGSSGSSLFGNKGTNINTGASSDSVTKSLFG